MTTVPWGATCCRAAAQIFGPSLSGMDADWSGVDADWQLADPTTASTAPAASHALQRRHQGTAFGAGSNGAGNGRDGSGAVSAESGDPGAATGLWDAFSSSSSAA